MKFAEESILKIKEELVKSLISIDTNIKIIKDFSYKFFDILLGNEVLEIMILASSTNRYDFDILVQSKQSMKTYSYLLGDYSTQKCALNILNDYTSI